MHIFMMLKIDILQIKIKNYFLQQIIFLLNNFFENDDEYNKRITNLFYELDICKSEKEFNEVKNKHLQKLHKIIETKLI